MPNREAKVMVFSAHAADFCQRSGGTIARYTQNGGRVKVVCASVGERGESHALWRKDPTVGEEKVKRIRQDEAEEAAAVLGAEIEFLDLGDNPLIFDRDRLMLLTE